MLCDFEPTMDRLDVPHKVGSFGNHNIKRHIALVEKFVKVKATPRVAEFRANVHIVHS